ncbi:MAG: DUF424 family protein [Desulfurococcales archaeon]|nr:DUF424 family protein [Desulfurococcales archaeon]
MTLGGEGGSCSSNSDKFYLKIINAGPYIIASIVDDDVLGRVERDPKTGLTISISESFYRGTLITKSEALKAMASYDYLILAGCRAVELGIELGIVDPRSVLEINGLRYVQVMRSYF